MLKEADGEVLGAANIVVNSLIYFSEVKIFGDLERALNAGVVDPADDFGVFHSNARTKRVIPLIELVSRT